MTHDMRDTSNDSEHGHTPQELQAIESSLDRLGASERNAPDEGVADRIFDSTSKPLTEPAPRLSIVRVYRSGWLRAAAAIALLATAGFIGVRVMSQGTTQSEAQIEFASLEAELEELAYLDEQWSSFAAVEVASLNEQLDTLDASLEDFWSASEAPLEEESL